MPSSKGYAALSAQSRLAPFNFDRREPGASEIVVEIPYRGVCHSDLHMARNEWGSALYPLTPATRSWAKRRPGSSLAKEPAPGNWVGAGKEIELGWSARFWS
jgi:uncharacterized zinc-type alcohol dehydrogenase-like protein